MCGCVGKHACCDVITMDLQRFLAVRHAREQRGMKEGRTVNRFPVSFCLTFKRTLPAITANHEREHCTKCKADWLLMSTASVRWRMQQRGAARGGSGM